MAEPATATPLLEQYERVRSAHPGHLVLFRVGDFYETFGDDARLLSRELEIVLTARAPDRDGARVPMAGVPHHALETYLGRLVRKGYKVAVCDQVEDARLAKGLVRREVTRVVTPGTVVEERILPGPDHNFLASVVVPATGPSGFAVVDVTTGEWFDGAAPPGVEGLVAAIAPFAPREIVLATDPPRLEALRAALHREHPGARLEPAPATEASPPLPEALAPTGDVAAATLVAAAGLATYVRAAQPRLLPFLERSAASPLARLALDGKSLRHLEIAAPMNPDDPTSPTLLSTWDATVTAPGRRTLAFWLRHPLADLPAIVRRQEIVGALVERGAELLGLRSELRPVLDLSRIATRVAGRRVQPAELIGLRESLGAVERVRAWLERTGVAPLQGLAAGIDPVPRLRRRLDEALPAEVGSIGDAPRFRPGFAADLDALATAERDAVAALEALERREQSASGIRGLKLGYNQVFGYYFEITRPNLDRAPAHFRRKQTLAQAERFTTEELGHLEETILAARDRRGDLEAEQWERFLVEIEASIPALHRLARTVGELDALGSFALVAQERGYVRPLVDNGTAIQIRDGRHPVLDRTMEGRFVANDVELDAGAGRMIVLTGPNMSGKSTYMRQIGLLVVLAQAGAFVPARYARIGLVTALYTRMGFTDEIGRGKSSFMVEMAELAEIVGAADARSLVLLDEIGRGTSTFDGLAIAWATLRHLHDRIGCRTVVATHYHQLTELVESLPGARNAHLAARETGDQIVFLHRLVPGSTDRSYGVHVARLAGLPPELLAEAERSLRRLEASGVGWTETRGGKAPVARYTQAVLLAEEAIRDPPAIESAIRALDPERMTPMEALAFLTEWRRRLAGGGPPDPA